ncbi:MAG: M1 family metallopeptidase [Bacteroidetes bacterium]|jgi:aminopeptidase N|nr:M1 family metallopeptidase [Bacteroidota bacterium]
MRKYILCLFSLCLLFCLSASAQSPGAVIDVQHYGFNIQLNDKNDTIKGQADVSLRYLKDAQSFQVNLVKQKTNGKGMLVSSITENGKPISFQQNADDITITDPAKAGSEHIYTITYSGIPADGLIISTNKFGHRTFFGDNWPNRAHNWLPCVDEPADKATVDFIVTAPDHYQVVSNGLKVDEKALPDNMKLTHWSEKAQCPTKVMVIGVADFAIDHTGDVNNIPVYTYVFPENKDKGFASYAVAKEILAYYMDKVGPYAFEKLANVQSKTIFGGMENSSCIFYFEESVGDRGIEELMAHEIAHQWFGDAASETNFSHLWLSEGFATYMTNVYLEHKYGIDTLKQRLKADRETVFDFEKKRKTPVVDTTVHDNYMVLLNANSYQKGGWVLHMLRRKLGDEAYWKGIRAYYKKYDGKNANTEDLRTELETASGQNLQQFFKQWIYTGGAPHLNITWHYDAAKKAVDLTVTQKQAIAFDLQLELSIAGKTQVVSVKNKVTTISIPVKSKPAAIAVDPNINLLATFEVKEAIQ